MPVYAWKGLDDAGKAVGGTKDADGPKALRQTLRKDGIFVTEHSEVLGGVGGRPGGGAKLATGEKVSFFKREIDLGGLLERVRPQDVAVLTRQLATLLKAGIPLAEALGALVEQADNKKLAIVLAEIRQKVNEGDVAGRHAGAAPEDLPGPLREHGPLGRGGGQPGRRAAAPRGLHGRAERAARQGVGRDDLPDHHDGGGRRS